MQVHALNAADAPLRLEEWEAGEFRIAAATLNVEKTLNALSLPMIDILAPQLQRWADDPRVVCLWLGGAGERAFAAGGDIQALYASVTRNHAAGAHVDDYAETFFEREYRLDFALHRFPKPIVAWGHGVIMGGGLGLLSAASHRILTERARIAMPEVTIGLFPDAGATWLLRNADSAWAAWLGLTGANMNQADAVALGLGNFPIQSTNKAAIQAALAAAAWRGDASADSSTITNLLQPFVQAPDPSTSALVRQRANIAQALTPLPATASDALARLSAIDSDDEYVVKAVAAARHGCPTTVGIVLEQLRRAATLDLAGCFRLEMVVATHCARNREFAEGVRALLIDKDNAPRWQYPDANALPAGWIESHFEPPWTQHPLHDL